MAFALLVVHCGASGPVFPEAEVRAEGRGVERHQWAQCQSRPLFGQRFFPLLVGGPFVDRLAPLGWNVSFIAAHHPLSVRVAEVQGAARKIPYVTKKQKFPLAKRPETRTVRLSMQKLLQGRNESQGAARYFSSSLADFDAPMKHDFPEAASCFYHRVPFGIDDPSANVSHVWISTGKPITALHYDANHNFFLQLIGHKEFLLIPPSELSKLHLFPWLSELSRQAGVDNGEYAVDGFLFEEFSNVSAIRVSLGPGDLLYVPPYWGHRVASKSNLVVSLNAWSDVDDVFLLDVELPKIVLPFEMSWSEAKKSVTLIYWFKVLHGAIIPEREHFMARMLRDRYRMANAPASCEIDCGEEHLMSDAEREKFRRYAEPIVEKFEGMGKGSPFARDVREIQLANYLEKTADVIFEADDCRIVQFFRLCVAPENVKGIFLE